MAVNFWQTHLWGVDADDAALRKVEAQLVDAHLDKQERKDYTPIYFH